VSCSSPPQTKSPPPEKVEPCTAIAPLLSPLERLDKGELPSSVQTRAKSIFEKYDRDGDGVLDGDEFGALLHDFGLDLNSAAYREAIEVVASPGARGLGFEDFASLLAHETRKNCGYSPDGVLELRRLFRLFDKNSSGMLEPAEYSRLLQDIGCAPRSKEDSMKLASLMSSCRADGQLGPLTFDEFTRLFAGLAYEDPNLMQQVRMINALSCIPAAS